MDTGFSGLRGEMNAGFSEIRGEMSRLEGRLRGEMNTGFSELRGEMNARFSESRAEMGDQGKRHDRDFKILFGALITLALGLSGLMAKGFGWIH
jgi:hypothetical protein